MTAGSALPFRSGHLAAALLAVVALAAPAVGQAQNPGIDARVYGVIEAVSAQRIEADIRRLVGFGTRNTLSDTLSATRGIGAARRWIKGEFDRISAACGGCLDVSYQRSLVRGDPDSRIREDAWVVSVVAVLRGTVEPDRYVIMSGDIDARASDATDPTTDTPGANDNASGMAGVMEAARVLSRHRFGANIAFAALAGEEQGLFGGRHMAQVARDEGWDIDAVLNNDMIGNIHGIDGVIDNSTFRVFSQPTPLPDHQPEGWSYRFHGGEVDGPSRQVARYVDRVAEEYFPNLDALMIYRLDRFGRGGHHRPFNDAGYPGVRIMETHEHYVRQHQDLRTEDGVAFGDVLEWVDFDYAAKLTALNAAVLASMAWAPPAPAEVRIGGGVAPAAVLAWEPVRHPDLAGYRVYWRDTTAPQWQHSRFIGMAGGWTFEGLVIDNYLFGVAAVGRDGSESVVAFPTGLLSRR